MIISSSISFVWCTWVFLKLIYSRKFCRITALVFFIDILKIRYQLQTITFQIISLNMFTLNILKNKFIPLNFNWRFLIGNEMMTCLWFFVSSYQWSAFSTNWFFISKFALLPYIYFFLTRSVFFVLLDVFLELLKVFSVLVQASQVPGKL